MLLRLLFLSVALGGLSSCLATPRLFSMEVDDYEPPPPEPEKPKEEATNAPRVYIVNDVIRGAIRKQVRDEIMLEEGLQQLQERQAGENK